MAAAPNGGCAEWSIEASPNGSFALWLMVDGRSEATTINHTPEAPYAGGAIRRRRHTPEAPYAGGAIRRRRHTPEAPYAGGAINPRFTRRPEVRYGERSE